MVSVAVCSGVRMCSQTAAAISAKAKPVTPATKAAAKRRAEKQAELENRQIHRPLPKEGSSAWMAVHLTGRLRYPRSCTIAARRHRLNRHTTQL